MFKGGSIKPIIIAFLAINAILIAYSFPYLVFAYENKNLDGYGIHYAAEPVRVESENITFSEKLRNMSMIMDNSSYVVINEEAMENGEYDMRLSSSRAATLATDAFIDIFLTDEFLSETGVTREEVRQRFITYNENVNMILIIRPDTKDMYLGWSLNIYFDTGSANIIIDDESGKLLSVAVYIYDDPDLVNVLENNYFDEEFGNRFADYYEMKYLDSEYSTLISTINDYHSNTEYISRVMKIMGDDPDQELELPYIVQMFSDSSINIYFNYFSYSTIGIEINETIENDSMIEYNTVIGDDEMNKQNAENDTNSSASKDNNSKNKTDYSSTPDKTESTETASSTDADNADIKPVDQPGSDTVNVGGSNSGGTNGSQGTGGSSTGTETTE